MIRNTRHTGLVVRDLKRSLDFYRTVFGFCEFSRATESGEFIEKLVGIEGVVLEWAKLSAPDGSLLELLQYHSHPAEAPVENAPANQLGCSHVAFTVDDIDATRQAIEAGGGSIVHDPQVSPDGNVRVMYAHDPDGIILELVEELRVFAPNREDIGLIVYDFDGVMTDNRVFVREDGLESVAANRGDGLGVGMIRKLGIEQFILSTEVNPVVRKRAEKLKLECIHGSSDKVAALAGLADEKGVDLTKVLFVGNDVNDLGAMKSAGIRVAPADAHADVLAVADLVTHARGGFGVIRELADVLTKSFALEDKR